MQLRLTEPILRRLRAELRRAGRREIGGVLMGEHVEGDVFQVVELTVQSTGGSHVGFMRHPEEHKPQLDAFFERTGGDYTRFNYLGEWHSHPSFEPVPSLTDLQTMQSIVADPQVGANFLVLVVVRLGLFRRLELSAVAILSDGEMHPVSVAINQHKTGRGLFSRCWKWISMP
jgi:[CysO sulfur-carrier protein]-S-L-cysteine hydrolase